MHDNLIKVTAESKRIHLKERTPGVQDATIRANSKLAAQRDRAATKSKLDKPARHGILNAVILTMSRSRVPSTY